MLITWDHGHHHETLAMQGVLKNKGIDARVSRPIAMPTVCETYFACQRHSPPGKGQGGNCAAGTGLPFFTTDTGQRSGRGAAM